MASLQGSQPGEMPEWGALAMHGLPYAALLNNVWAPGAAALTRPPGLQLPHTQHPDGHAALPSSTAHTVHRAICSACRPRSFFLPQCRLSVLKPRRASEDALEKGSPAVQV